MGDAVGTVAVAGMEVGTAVAVEIAVAAGTVVAVADVARGAVAFSFAPAAVADVHIVQRWNYSIPVAAMVHRIRIPRSPGARRCFQLRLLVFQIDR